MDFGYCRFNEPMRIQALRCFSCMTKLSPNTLLNSALQAEAERHHFPTSVINRETQPGQCHGHFPLLSDFSTLLDPSNIPRKGYNNDHNNTQRTPHTPMVSTISPQQEQHIQHQSLYTRYTEPSPTRLPCSTESSQTRLTRTRQSTGDERRMFKSGHHQTQKTQFGRTKNGQGQIE